MINKFIDRLERNKFKLLLASCILVVLTLPVPVNSIWNNIINSIVLSINIIAGIIIISKSKTIFHRIIIWIGYSIIVLQFFELLFPNPLLNNLRAILYIIFFTMVSLKLYKEIYLIKEVNEEMLSAVGAGFFLLAILSAFVFMILESVTPVSFNGISESLSLFDNYLYFSLITLLTIGYGDMVPISAQAKSVVLVLSIIGHFYTVMVMGVVIGKFLYQREKNN
jgi:voltage-gated potassium channel